jgi:hypothetical protein
MRPVNATRYHERLMKKVNIQQIASGLAANKHFEYGNSGAVPPACRGGGDA